MRKLAHTSESGRTTTGEMHWTPYIIDQISARLQIGGLQASALIARRQGCIRFGRSLHAL